MTGSFEGNIYLVDNRTEGKPVIVFQRPHVDAVTTITSNRLNSNLFASNARKDDFTYIWDIRNLSDGTNLSFNQFFQQRRESNQRINIVFSKSGNSLISGSENGKILIGDIYESPF